MKDFIKENLNDICASVQRKLIDMLMNKLRKAAAKHRIDHVAISGGVSANSELRIRIQEEGIKHGWQTYIPAFEYCTDNAGMIAIAAHYKYLAKEDIYAMVAYLRTIPAIENEVADSELGFPLNLIFPTLLVQILVSSLIVGNVWGMWRELSKKPRIMSFRIYSGISLS